MKKLAAALVLAFSLILSACGGEEPSKPVSAEAVLLNEISGSWTIEMIDGKAVAEYAAENGLRGFEAAGNMTVSEDGKTVTLTDCDKTWTSDAKLGLTGFSLLDKDGEKLADANYSYENKTITLKYSDNAERAFVYKRGLFDFSSPNFVEGVTAELTSVTPSMISGDWTIETINGMSTAAYAESIGTDESSVIINAFFDETASSLMLTDSVSSVSYGLALKTDGFDILNNNGSVYAAASYSYVNQRFSYSLTIDEIEYKYVFMRGKYDFGMNVYVEGLENEAPISLDRIKGEWVCKTISGQTPQEFSEENGYTLNDTMNMLTVAEDGKTAVLENCDVKQLADIVLKSNGFEVLNTDGSVLYSVRYSAADGTLNYKVKIIDKQLDYVMERGHFDFESEQREVDSRVTLPPETEAAVDTADYSEDDAEPDDTVIEASDEGVPEEDLDGEAADEETSAPDDISGEEPTETGEPDEVLPNE